MAIRIKSRNNESVAQMLRRFKKLCEKEGLTKDIKRRQYYEKPSERARRDARRSFSRNVRPLTGERTEGGPGGGGGGKGGPRGAKGTGAAGARGTRGGPRGGGRGGPRGGSRGPRTSGGSGGPRRSPSY